MPRLFTAAFALIATVLIGVTIGCVRGEGKPLAAEDERPAKVFAAEKSRTIAGEVEQPSQAKVAGQVGTESKQSTSSREEIKRSFVVGIIRELATLKGKYPEFAEFDAAALEQQRDGQGFSYHYRYTKHDERKIDHVGENGCAIMVGFAKRGDPSALSQSNDLPARDAQVRWYVKLSPNAAAASKDIRDIITSAIQALEERLAEEPRANLEWSTLKRPHPDEAAATTKALPP